MLLSTWFSDVFFVILASKEFLSIRVDPDLYHLKKVKDKEA